MPADSERVAPIGFYTSRTDIPKYTRHDGPDDRVYGNVVEGGDQAQNDNNAGANNDNRDVVQENSNNEVNQENIDGDRDDGNESGEGMQINLPTEPRTNNNVTSSTKDN